MAVTDLVVPQPGKSKQLAKPSPQPTAWVQRETRSLVWLSDRVLARRIPRQMDVWMGGRVGLTGAALGSSRSSNSVRRPLDSARKKRREDWKNAMILRFEMEKPMCWSRRVATSRTVLEQSGLSGLLKIGRLPFCDQLSGVSTRGSKGWEPDDNAFRLIQSKGCQRSGLSVLTLWARALTQGPWRGASLGRKCL